jgi:hypothetical protein
VKKNSPPDTRHEPAYSEELTLEVSYSREKGFRSVISLDANRRFRVRREKWDVGVPEFTGSGHWLPDQRGTTIAVSLETARVLALEKLEETPEGVGEK